MLCQNCNINPATIHYTTIINGKKTETRLCQVCANSNSDFAYDHSITINDLLSNFFNIPLNHPVQDKNDSEKCSNCGLSFEEFTNTGRFGCPKCYEAFKDKLGPILKRLHGSVMHSGKIPGATGSSIKTKTEIDELKDKLKVAVKNEQYELAAKLRDKIKELEKDSDDAKE